MGRHKVDIKSRIYKYTDRSGECWVWTSARQGKGYGCVFYDGRSQAAHRVSYTVFVGKIPDGMQLDHLCMNKLCVNPSHLEPVTNAENQRRAAVIRGGYPTESLPLVDTDCVMCGARFKCKVLSTRKYCSNSCSCKAYRARMIS